MKRIKTEDTKTLKCEIIYNAKGVFVERVEYKHLDDEGNLIGHKKVYYGIYEADGTLIDCVNDKKTALKIIAEMGREQIMQLWFFTVKKENRYGETICVTTGIVKAETMEEAEKIVDKDFGSDYSYGLTIDGIKEHEKIYAYSVYKHVFQ